MLKLTIKAGLLGGALLLAQGVQAAGLGKLTVLSALGQPLAAEIELVSVQKDEISSLAARMASVDTFRLANIEYAVVLSSIKFSVEARSDGQPYLKLVSSQPVNEPFLDMLIELNWASGRLVREYTTLIDPPGFAPATPTAPAEVAAAATEAVAAAPASVEKPAVQPAAKPAPAEQTYGPIKRGETLSKIAASVKPEGVSLEQMLVGLYRSNRDAFDGSNMNRLRTGKVLHLPQNDQLTAIAQTEAVREIRVQVADWRAYRQKLAAALEGAQQQPARQKVSGKIAAAVEEKAAAKEQPAEVLRLSKGEPAGKGGATDAKTLQARVHSLEEEATAREKSLREANERVAQLEKTVKEMQRLLEMKSPAMAELQKQAAAKQALPVPAKAETTPAKPAAPAKAEPAPAAAKPEPAKIAPPAAAPAPAAPQAAPAKPRPKPIAPPPPPPAPGLLDQILGNPLYLAAVGGIIALLGVLGLMAARKKRAQAAPAEAGEITGATKAAPAKEEQPAAEEVDPLAEAEVYIAYGRDTQAESILKEALARAPEREDVHLKLLEIYSLRKDKAAFNAQAATLHALSGGRGANWSKAVEMGYELDSANPLYAAGKAGTEERMTQTQILAAGTATAVAAAGAAAETGSGLDFNLDFEPAASAAEAQQPAPAGTTSEMDIDLGFEPAAEKPDIVLEGAPAGTQTDIVLEAPATTATDFDFNIPAAEESSAMEQGGFTPDGTMILEREAAPAPEPEQPAAATEPAASAEMIAFDLGTLGAAEPAPPAPQPAAEATGLPDIEFKIDFEAPAAPAPAAPQPAVPEIDLSGISLDLGEAPKTEVAAGAPRDDHWYDVQTKFDLAKAYQEMGDKDGAKEILQEVVQEGDAQQQEEAKALLASLE